MRISDWSSDVCSSDLDTLEFRDYDVTRTRLGASLSLDWRPSDTTTLFVRGLYSRFADQELSKRMIFEMDADPYAGDADHESFRYADGEINVEPDLKDSFEVQHDKTESAGGQHKTGPWKRPHE